MKRKKVLAVAVVFAVLLLAALIFTLAFSMKKITIQGCEYYSEEDIRKKLVTEPADRNTLLFYLRYQMGHGNTIPFIQQVDVEIKSASSVLVRVYEKRMTGCVKNMNEYIYFDKDGTVMEVTGEPLSGIPFFTGLQVKEYALYDKLKVSDDSVFPIILSFSQLIERYELPIERIQMSSLSGVTMYSGSVKILFGKQKMYDEAVAELNHMLPKVLELGQPGTIDMRNFKEGQATTIFKPDGK